MDNGAITTSLINKREIVRPRLTMRTLRLDTDGEEKHPLRVMWQVSDAHLSPRSPLYPPPVQYRLVRASPSTVAARIDAYLRSVAVCHHDETCLTAHYASGESLQVYLFKKSVHITMVECLGSSRLSLPILLAAQGSGTKKRKPLLVMKMKKYKKHLKSFLEDDARRVCEWMQKDRIDAQRLGFQLLLILLKQHKYHSLLLGTCPKLPEEAQYIYKFTLNNILTNTTHTCLALECWSQTLSSKSSLTSLYEHPPAFINSLWTHLQGCNRPPGQAGMSCAHEAHLACICLNSLVQNIPITEIKFPIIKSAMQCHFYKPLQQEAQRLWKLSASNKLDS